MMHKRIRKLGDQRRSFAFQYNPLQAGPLRLGLVNSSREDTSSTCCFYGLPSVDLAVERVKDRVRWGGHNVSEATVRRRYERGLENFFRLYKPVATQWCVYDNTVRQ